MASRHGNIAVNGAVNSLNAGAGDVDLVLLDLATEDGGWGDTGLYAVAELDVNVAFLDSTQSVRKNEAWKVGVSRLNGAAPVIDLIVPAKPILQTSQLQFDISSNTFRVRIAAGADNVGAVGSIKGPIDEWDRT
jgi:hypothetical protein